MESTGSFKVGEVIRYVRPNTMYDFRPGDFGIVCCGPEDSESIWIKPLLRAGKYRAGYCVSKKDIEKLDESGS